VSQFEIAFYGELVEGVSESVAKQHIAQLFKTTTAQVERMFVGKRVVIRNKLDLETAQKYIVALQKRGARCQIEKMGQPGEPYKESAQAPAREANSQGDVSQALGQAAEAGRDSVSKSHSSTAVASNTGLRLAGEKADEILAHTDISLDPLGVRLSDEIELEAPELPGLDSMSLAPLGSDLGDKRDAPPVMVPDISHLHLE